MVIVTYRSKDHVGGCLNSLRKQTLLPREVIVVDNASGDGTADYVRSYFPEVNILELNANQGYGGGVNAGCSIASTDVIAVFNPDVTLAADVVEKMTARLREGGVGPSGRPVGAVTAQVLNHGERAETRGGTINLLGTRIPEFFGDPTAVFYPSGAAFAFRRSAIQLPFDADLFLYYEDVWLGWRLRLSGYEVVKAPDAVVDHYPQGSVRSASGVRVAFYQERNRILVMLGFYSLPTMLKLLPVFVLDGWVRLLTGPWRGKPMSAVFFAHVHVLMSPRYVVMKRWKWRARVRAGDAELLKYLSARWVPEDSRWNRLLVAYCRWLRIPAAELSGK